MIRRIVAFRTVLVAAVVLVLVEAVAGLVDASVYWPPLLVVGCTRMVQIALLLMIASVLDRGLVVVGLQRQTLAHGLGRGLLWSGIFGVGAGFAAVLLVVAGYDPLAMIRTPVPAGGMPLVLLFLVGGLIGPLAEEIFFRGMVYGFLRRWGAPLAIVGSSLLFVLPHLVQNRLPLVQAAGGLVFGLSYEREKNLIAPLVIHVLGNLALFTLSLVA